MKFSQISSFFSEKRLDIINYLIILYAFVLSFPPQVKRPIIILMIIFWLTDSKRFKIDILNKNVKKLFITFFIFLFFVLLSFFWSDVSFIDALKYIKRYWYFLPIFIIFKYIKKEYIPYAINSFLLGMLISEIISYGNFFGIWKIGLGNRYDPTVFVQHSLYGVFLSLCAIIIFVKFLYSKNNIQKILYIIFFITATSNLLLNAGRTGYFVFFITIFVIVFYHFKINFKIIFSTVIIVILMIFFAYQYSHNFHHRVNEIKSSIINVIDKDNYNTSIGSRIGLTLIAKNLFLEDPVLGVGVANNINKKHQYIKKHQFKNFKRIDKLVHFHNSFLEILTQFGLVGLSLFLYMLWLITRIKIKDKIIDIFKTSILSIFIFGSLADMLFYLNAPMSLFAFSIGLVLAQNRYELQKTD